MTRDSLVQVERFRLSDPDGKTYPYTAIINCNGGGTGFSSGTLNIYLKPQLSCTSSILFETSNDDKNFNLSFDARKIY